MCAAFILRFANLNRRPVEPCRRRWKDNIKTNNKEEACHDVDRIYVSGEMKFSCERGNKFSDPIKCVELNKLSYCHFLKRDPIPW
jgi:hypothetical protein